MPWPHFGPGERTAGTIGQEAGWAPEPVWTQRLDEKSFASAGDRTPQLLCMQNVCTRYNFTHTHTHTCISVFRKHT
jgi:hypothetical protein